MRRYLPQLFKIACCAWAMVLLFTETHAQDTSRMQRVKGIRQYMYRADVISMRDSAVFMYSGSRGSSFDALDASYNLRSGYNLTFDLALSVLPASVSNVVQTSLQHNVAYDSAYAYKTYVQTGQVSSVHYKNAYRGDTLVAHILYKDTSTASAYSLHHPSGGVKLIQAISHDLKRNTQDTIYRRLLVFNTKQQVMVDSIFRQGGTATLNRYAYNFGNDTLLSVIETADLNNNSIPPSRSNYSYNKDGMLTERLGLAGNAANPAVFDTISRDEFRYDANGRLTVRIHNTANTFNRAETHYHYHPSGYMDTITEIQFRADTIALISRSVFYLNDYHNPDSSFHYQEQQGSIADIKYRIYYDYELYTIEGEKDSTIVSPLPPKALVVYSNPARNSFKIKWNDKKPTTPVYVNIFSSSGQRVRKVFIEKAATENTVDIRGLSSGVYYLDIRTYSGGQLYSGAVTVMQ